MEGCWYRIPSSTTYVSPSSCCSSALTSKPCTKSGEPSFVQICLYNLADRGARKGTMIKLTTKKRVRKEVSITRGSFKNSVRYFLTSFVSGLSGVPKLISNTPVFIVYLSLFYCPYTNSHNALHFFFYSCILIFCILHSYILHSVFLYSLSVFSPLFFF